MKKGVANILGIVIGSVLVAVIFGALLPGIADDTIGETANSAATNVTGATAALVNLVPLFLAIVVIIGVLTLSGLKVIGKL